MDQVQEDQNTRCFWMDSVCDTDAICGDGICGEPSVEFIPKRISTMKSTMEQYEDEMNKKEPTEESDLSSPNRRIWVVTTAALPWMTGTAMNPLMRALYLTKNRPKGYVTLVIPWLTMRSDRLKLYGENFVFSDGEVGQMEQEQYIRKYARERCDTIEEEKNLNIKFYASTYSKNFGSIFPTLDISSSIPDSEADVAILEEPEHLNWFRVQSKNQHEKEEQSAFSNSENTSDVDEEKANNIRKLGWAHKFRHVVGIIHTNYAAYARQNGFGTAVVGAPAITAASALVVRAYCHKVIKLSAVLPVFAPSKEITENVHGVRNEFLALPSIAKTNGNKELSSTTTAPLTTTANVYFIGKLLWAKGFDNMLEIQDKYRRATGQFFPIDVYGSGPDEKHIIRAFHGRIDRDGVFSSRSLSPQPRKINQNSQTDAVFENPLSIRSQSYESRLDKIAQPSEESMEGIELNQCFSIEHDRKDPLSILYDISEKSVDTGIKTTKAVYHLADSAIQRGLAMAFTVETSSSEKNEGKKNLVFDPPKSRFELRRHPIPANFLGRKDHALLRNLPYKVFFNPSVSEVLCTTTAEALAMGFFVIIPRHPSNEFFFQFSNCLPYDTIQECVEHLRWTLLEENKPKPLSEEEASVFTWDAANARLIKASIVTKGEQRDRIKSGMVKMDRRIAWLHSKSAKTGDAVKTLFVPMDKHEHEISHESVEEAKK